MSNVEGFVGFGGCKGLQPSKVRNGLRSFGPGIRRASGPDQPAFSCEDFSEKSFASLINRARAREAIKPNLFSL